jgi:hypothetical protein
VGKTASSLPRRTKTWTLHHPGAVKSIVAACSSLLLAWLNVARLNIR